MNLNTAKYIPKFFLQEKNVPWIIGVISLAVGIQKILEGHGYINNFIIFRTSFFHLINNLDLYKRYPEEYNDLFLYSPTFAVLMAPLAYLPIWLDLILWSGLNCLAVYFAIKLFPFNNGRKKLWMVYLIFFELITSLQNVQTAPMVAAFIVLSFIFFERKNVFLAAFFIILAFYIKIYALAAAMFFLLYPQRLKFILSILFWMIVLGIAPLLVISMKQLGFLYESWYHLTTNIHLSEDVGVHSNIRLPLSVMSWLDTWFHLTIPAMYVQLAGTILLCLPLIRYKSYNVLRFRILILASLLIWSMIFNHIAESASYIVAVMGVSIWFLVTDKNKVTYTLMILAYVFTSLSATDLFPRYLRDNFVIPYVLKAVPCILIWFYIQYELIKKQPPILRN